MLRLDNPFALSQTHEVRERLIRWEAPLEGWVLLNIDGALKGNPGTGAGGGIIRGHQEEWIKGFVENFGQCTSVKAKLRATLCGLKLARDLGL